MNPCIQTSTLLGKEPGLRNSIQSRINLPVSAESQRVTNPDTDLLITLAQRGDTSARHQLLLRHRERLRRMVVSMLNPRLSARIDPSDVLQDAFAKAAQKLPDYLKDQPGDSASLITG